MDEEGAVFNNGKFKEILGLEYSSMGLMVLPQFLTIRSINKSLTKIFFHSISQVNKKE